MRSWHIFAAAALLIAGVAAGGWLLSRNQAAEAGVVQTAQAGDLKVTLRLDEQAIGTRTIDVVVNDAAGRAVQVEELRLRFSMTEMDMGLSEILAEPLGSGRFRARGQFFSMAGNWLVNAVIARGGQAPLEVPFTLAVAAPGEAGGPLNPLPNDEPTILAGQRLYLANCTTCHGASGKGDGPAAAGLNPRPVDFAQHMVQGKHTDGQVFLWIKNGFPNTAMPAWGGRLTDEQIWQLVRYLRTYGQAAPATQPTSAPQAAVPMAQEPLPPLIFTRRGNVWRSAGAVAAPTQLTQLAEGSYAEYPSYSPDGSRIAFIGLAPAPITSTLPLPSSTLYVMPASGGVPQPIWRPSAGLLGMFAWAPDGKSLLVAATGVPFPDSSGGRELRLVRFDLATGTPTPLIADALDPAISRDGTQLAFLKLSEDGYTMNLMLAGPDGSGARELLNGEQFQGFYAPRFAPDGQSLLVAAIGGPETDEQGIPLKARAPSLLERALALLEPPSASAHGLPWDLWSINTDGTGLRRVTRFYEDLPMASFAPDGSQVAIMGLGGIYLMQPDGSNLRRIDPTGDHGGLEWVPR